ncbi:hypothetical protein [Bartonella sp. A05]|uniref:hypothetical protein n=1 Tax=Bartonella sp. A05 TaxID=2967261 RepID=UPI0022A9BEE1|nr:hypothetical protein [Bartonella sp. A05]MCZ2203718.1 hypothetical protein [Bartonella sp. A05]
MDEENLIWEEQNQFTQNALQESENHEEVNTVEGEKAENIGENREESQNAEGIEAPPDPQKDFMGYMQWLGKTLHKQELLRAQSQHSSVPSEAEQLRSFFQKSVADVKQKHQDFDQAADFIYDTRAKQLAACAALYPEMADPKVIDERIGNELKQIIRDCAQKKQNPAQVIYTIAQKIGYTNTLQSNSVETIQERQNSARTLAAHNGLTPTGTISLEMLDKMSEAEFSTWINDPKNKAAFNHLMGGGDL